MANKNLTKQQIIAVVILIVVAIFFYWQSSRVSCTNKALAFLSNSDLSLSQGEIAFDLGYKVCMTKHGF